VPSPPPPLEREKVILQKENYFTYISWSAFTAPAFVEKKNYFYTKNLVVELRPARLLKGLWFGV
jgi:hypothetical protein